MVDGEPLDGHPQAGTVRSPVGRPLHTADARPIASWLAPLGLWTAAACTLLVLRHAAAALVGVRTDLGPLGTFILIAQEGYSGDDVLLGWFPGYSLMIRLAHWLGLDWITAAKTVAAVGAAVAVVALWEWMRSMGTSDTARTCALTALFAWPAGFMLLGSVSLSEGLFLGLAITAFAANERGHPWIAGVLLAGASLTRPTAVVFVLAMVVRNLERAGVLTVMWQRRRRPSMSVARGRFRIRLLIPLVGLAGIIGYFAYCGVVHGDPFVYLRVQSTLTPSPPKSSWKTWTHSMMVTQYQDWIRSPAYFASSALNAALTVLVAVSVPRVVRRFGLAYGVLVVGVVGLIWFGAWDFPSAARYLLAAFPFFALVGEWVGRQRARAFPIAVSAVVMVTYAVVFHSGRSLVTW